MESIEQYQAASDHPIQVGTVEPLRFTELTNGMLAVVTFNDTILAMGHTKPEVLRKLMWNVNEFVRVTL